MPILMTVLLMLFAVPCFTAYSQPADEQAGINPAILKKATAIEADFTQVRHFSELDYDMTVKGHMSLKPGKELVWRTDSPMKTVCTMTPKGLTLWDAETKKTNTVSAKGNLWLAAIFGIQDKLLAGDLKALESQFRIERKAKATILLFPKEEMLAGMFKSIQITFNDGMDAVSGIVFTEKSGDTINISFTNVRN